MALGKGGTVLVIHFEIEIDRLASLFYGLTIVIEKTGLSFPLSCQTLIIIHDTGGTPFVFFLVT